MDKLQALALEHASEILYVIRTNADIYSGKVEFMNNQVYPKLGYKPQEFMEDPGLWYSIIHPDDLETLRKSTQSMYGIAEPVTRVYRVRHKMTGDYRWVEDRVSPWVDDSGRFLGYVGSATDITEINERNAALRNFQRAVDQSPASVVITDTDGTIQYVSPKFTRLTGYTLEEAVGKNPRVLKSGLTPLEVYQDLWDSITSGREWHGEICNKKKNGELFWDYAYISPVTDESGKIVNFVAVHEDITYRKETSEQIRKQNEFIMTVLDSLDHPFYVINANDHTIELANKAAGRESMDRGESTKCYCLMHRQGQPCNNPDNPCPLEIVRKTKEPARVQHVHWSSDGKPHFEILEAHPIFGSEGNVAKVIEYSVEITERKLLEEQLAVSERNYRELVENALIGVYKTNLKGEILYANKAILEMLSYDSLEEANKVGLISLYKNPSTREHFMEVLKVSGKVESWECELLTKHGETKTMLLSASLDGDVISGMIKDIGEIKRLQDQLAQTQKLEALGTLAAGIAHDFNNILGVILGYAALLRRSNFDRNRLTGAGESIMKASQRGVSLVNQLLTFARKTDTTFEPVQIEPVVADIERLIRETFPKTIVVKTDLKGELPPILANAGQFHQVLLNLCVNARDAMPKGGEILISARGVSGVSLKARHPEADAPEYLEVEVSDTGIGMDELTQKKIFEPFFTTKDVGKGTGLGLSVVYGIVQSHKGFIEVASALGKGTTFRLDFPAQQSAAHTVHAANEAEEDLPGGTETILFIEDEEMLVELVKSTLDEKGYHVVVARDGEEGIDIFRRNKDRIAVVISDLGLPSLSGEEVAGNILEIDRSARILIASGFIQPETRRNLEKIGVKRFIEKPYMPTEILRAVRLAIDAAV